MRGYRQYCPLARAAEILATRWTLIIVRNLLLGCRTFGEILDGAPGIPRTLLSQRLRLLEQHGLVEREPNPRGRGSLYRLTDAGRDLHDVCLAIGFWGTRWLEVAPEHLDPYVLLWGICREVDRALLPDPRLTVRFEFRDAPRTYSRFWLVMQRPEPEVCVKPPGYEEDLVVSDRRRMAAALAHGPGHPRPGPARASRAGHRPPLADRNARLVGRPEQLRPRRPRRNHRIATRSPPWPHGAPCDRRDTGVSMARARCGAGTASCRAIADITTAPRRQREGSSVAAARPATLRAPRMRLECRPRHATVAGPRPRAHISANPDSSTYARRRAMPRSLTSAALPRSVAPRAVRGTLGSRGDRNTPPRFESLSSSLCCV